MISPSGNTLHFQVVPTSQGNQMLVGTTPSQLHPLNIEGNTPSWVQITPHPTNGQPVVNIDMPNSNGFNPNFVQINRITPTGVEMGPPTVVAVNENGIPVVHSNGGWHPVQISPDGVPGLGGSVELGSSPVYHPIAINPMGGEPVHFSITPPSINSPHPTIDLLNNTGQIGIGYNIVQVDEVTGGYLNVNMPDPIEGLMPGGTLPNGSIPGLVQGGDEAYAITSWGGILPKATGILGKAITGIGLFGAAMDVIQGGQSLKDLTDPNAQPDWLVYKNAQGQLVSIPTSSPIPDYVQQGQADMWWYAGGADPMNPDFVITPYDEMKTAAPIFLASGWQGASDLVHWMAGTNPQQQQLDTIQKMYQQQHQLNWMKQFVPTSAQNSFIPSTDTINTVNTIMNNALQYQMGAQFALAGYQNALNQGDYKAAQQWSTQAQFYQSQVERIASAALAQPLKEYLKNNPQTLPGIQDQIANQTFGLPYNQLSPQQQQAISGQVKAQQNTIAMANGQLQDLYSYTSEGARYGQGNYYSAPASSPTISPLSNPSLSAEAARYTQLANKYFNQPPSPPTNPPTGHDINNPELTDGQNAEANRYSELAKAYGKKPNKPANPSGNNNGGDNNNNDDHDYNPNNTGHPINNPNLTRGQNAEANRLTEMAKKVYGKNPTESKNANGLTQGQQAESDRYTAMAAAHNNNNNNHHNNDDDDDDHGGGGGNNNNSGGGGGSGGGNSGRSLRSLKNRDHGGGGGSSGGGNSSGGGGSSGGGNSGGGGGSSSGGGGSSSGGNGGSSGSGSLKSLKNK